MRISFARASFSYEAGQYVHIMIPKLTMYEWHPFSISSSPHEETVTLHIRVLGNWTKGLQSLSRSLPPESPLEFYLEGPCGALSVDVLGVSTGAEKPPPYKCVLFFSGGIGVTPMQSVCNAVMHEHSNDMKKVVFVWSVRQREIIGVMGDAVPNVPRGSRAPSSPFHVPTLVRHSFSQSFAGALSEEESEEADDEVLHTEFYMSRSRGETTVTTEPSNRPQSKLIGLSDVPSAEGEEFSPYLIRSRPDIPTLMRKMKAYALKNGEKRVAVLVCGPLGMVRDAMRESIACSADGQVAFDFHSETFDF